MAQITVIKELPDIRLTILGAGNMGEAILAGALRAGVTPDHVVMTDARPERRDEIAAKHAVTVTGDNQAAVQHTDVVIIAVKPKDVKALLEDIELYLEPQTVVVTIAAGLTLDFYDEHLAYAQPVVKVMPNTPAAIGVGVAALTPGSDATPEHVELVRRVFSGTGSIIEIPESYQAAAGAVAGSGPAYVFYLIDAMAEAGVAAGLTRDVALRLATETVYGSAKLIMDTGEHPALARERVTSPGGTTIQALAVMDRRGVRAAFVDAIAAAVKRTDEITAALQEEG